MIEQVSTNLALDLSGMYLVYAKGMLDIKEKLLQIFEDEINTAASTREEQMLRKLRTKFEFLFAYQDAKRAADTMCKCGEHKVPAGTDRVLWYWQAHGRDICTMELPNEKCWCGLLRHEHILGHKVVVG